LFEGQCFARWFIIAKLIGCGSLRLPVFCLDRDELLFSELDEACAPFFDTDYAATHDGPIQRAPLLINRLEPLLSFCDYTQTMLKCCAPRLKFQNDMRAWEATTIGFGWRLGNLSLPIKDSVFDNSLGCAQNCVMVDGGKCIVWKERKPYFVHQDGLLRAHTLHCWGPFKKYMSQYAHKAGI